MGDVIEILAVKSGIRTECVGDGSGRCAAEGEDNLVIGLPGYE